MALAEQVTDGGSTGEISTVDKEDIKDTFLEEKEKEREDAKTTDDEKA